MSGPVYAICTITSFNLKQDRKPGIDWDAVERVRCVGFYHLFTTAEEAVLKNIGDFNEAGYYSHIVIEIVEPGIYPLSAINHRTFYAWDGEKYVKVENFDDPLADVISYAPIG